MLFLIPCWGCPDRPMPVFGPPHHRQDREERQAETTADVQERSRGTTATGVNPTLSRTISAMRHVRRAPNEAGTRSVVGAQRRDLVGGFQRRGGGQRAEQGALLAEPAAEGAAAGQGGAEVGHDGSFRSCWGSRGLRTSRTSWSGVNVEAGSSRRMSP